VSVRPQTNLDTYHLLITRRGGTEILCFSEGPCYSFPSVDISRWQRIPEQINSQVKDRWNLDVYSLATLPSGQRDVSSSSAKYQLIECNGHDESLPSEARWISVRSLKEVSFHDARDFQMLAVVINKFDTQVRKQTEGPFLRLGWLNDLRNWIAKMIEPLGMRLTGKLRQLSASDSFSLIRFETTGPAVWFKAVGDPNTREFQIVSLLATLFPSFVPRMLGLRPEWNAWLMLEVEGTHPGGDSDYSLWKAVSSQLARLQVASLHETSHLLAAGCRNVTAAVLQGCVDDFFVVIEVLMKQQTKTTPPSLTSQEISDLKQTLKEALSILSETGFPEALNHLDFNPGNIFVTDDGCKFIDWAEAAIGHPVLTFQYLLEHYSRLHPTGSSRRSELASTFAAEWQPYVAPEAAACALSLAPLVAVFAHAVSTGAWHDPARYADPRIAAYLRSLVRRMKREADTRQNARMECLRA